MLTWLYLSHHHTMTELIPNLGTVGTEVLTDTPANLLRKEPKNYLSAILCGCQNLSACFGVQEKCLPFPTLQPSLLHNPANILSLWAFGLS